MSKYVAFLDILGFKEKLKKLKQKDAKSFIGRFSTTAFEQWENMSPTLVEGYIVSDSFILYTRDTSTQAVSQLLALVEKICQQEFIDNGILIRGAIAKGEFDRVEAREIPSLRKGLIVGQAYVDAYLVDAYLMEGSIKTAGIALTDEVFQDIEAYAEQRREYLQKHKRVSEYDSENLMHSVIQEILSDEPFSSIGCAVHFSLATLVKDYAPLTEEERKYARNPLTHVDFLLFNQMDKQPVLAIEVDGGSHKSGSKQAERDAKKNSILDKCAIPLLRLRTDGSGEKEKIRNALKRE